MLLGQLVYGVVRGFFVGRAEAKKLPDLEKWFQLVASISATAFWTFWGTLGAVGGTVLSAGVDPLTAFASGFFAAALAMAAAVLTLWKRSPLTKGMGVWAPLVVEEKALEAPGTYTEKPK